MSELGSEMLGIRDLRARVAEALDGISAAQARLVTDAVVGAITEALGQGCSLAIPGLGRWRPVYRAARSGTAPDGTHYEVPPKVVIRFRPARDLAERLQLVTGS